MDRHPVLVSTNKHGGPVKEEGGGTGGVVEHGGEECTAYHQKE